MPSAEILMPGKHCLLCQGHSTASEICSAWNKLITEHTYQYLLQLLRQNVKHRLYPSAECSQTIAMTPRPSPQNFQPLYMVSCPVRSKCWSCSSASARKMEPGKKFRQEEIFLQRTERIARALISLPLKYFPVPKRKCVCLGYSFTPLGWNLLKFFYDPHVRRYLYDRGCRKPFTSLAWCHSALKNK